MRTVFKRVLLLLLALCLILPGLPSRAEEETAETPAIYPLMVSREPANLEAADGVEPYDEFWFNTQIPADLSENPGLAWSLSIGDKTTYQGALPAGYDPKTLIEWGKYPGLNVDILHAHGFTGKGAVIAYVDQPIAPHEEYSSDRLHNTNNTSDRDSLHGPSVLSLLVGKDIGTAPEAEVYFYGFAAWEQDQARHAECLYQIIEQNKALPEDRKIRIVGFSDNIMDSEANADVFRAAVKACEDAGIMVWFCGEYGAISFTPYGDKNCLQCLSPTYWWQAGLNPLLVFVPESGRTTANTCTDSSYIYWGNGGLSWTMPYALGLYAIALEIDPALTQADLRTLIVDTAYINDVGMQIVNPVGFISAVLRRVGRDAEAQAMEDEVKARTRYLYAVMNTAAMTEEDLTAVGSYLAAMTDATVLIADAAKFTSVYDLYAALQADAWERGGTVAGVQIFGTASMVPAFQIQYRVQMLDEVYEGGTLLTDLFFGNFGNDVSLLGQDYNVLDHFAQGWDVDLVPQWPVARLTLTRGNYAAFFEKYKAFVLSTGLEQLEIVNLSNPIFNSKDPIDSMGRFLMRMDQEFHLMDVPYRLYGNLMGESAVTYPVLGGFEAKNMTAENRKGPVEFIINTHGQADNIDNAFYMDGQEQRQSMVNMSNIDQVLSENPYYLDAWACYNGSEMENNLTTAALKGQCVGMFSATAVISNNGVNWKVSLEEMEKSNLYYFYYTYLKALHEGKTRSEAFFMAQRAYGLALTEDSRLPLRGEGNYQFNLYNLLCYHNFGVMEPNTACLALYDTYGDIDQTSEGVKNFKIYLNEAEDSIMTEDSVIVTEGTPQGEVTELAEFRGNYAALHISRFTAQPLDNGYIRFTLAYAPAEPMRIEIYNWPDSDLVQYHSKVTDPSEPQELVFDIKKEDVSAAHSIVCSFSGTGDDFVFVEFSAKNVPCLNAP